jgi:hypothetical protein
MILASKMKNIIPLILIAVLLTSCTLTSSKKTPITEVNIRQGTNGLVMDFVQGTPPKSVYESRTSGSNAYEGIFEFSATLENKGASDIEQGYLTVGYEEDYITTAPNGGWTENDFTLSYSEEKTMRFSLKGKSLLNPAGDIKMVSNKLKTKMLEELSETHDSLVMLTACYDYSTTESATVCIDPNPYESGIKPCTVKDQTFTSQGAPIAVTKVETTMLPSGGNTVKPEFKIYIKNSGVGNVVSKDKIELACKSKLTEDEKKDLWNIVDIKLTLGGDENGIFECSPLPMRLKSDEDYVRCVYTNQIRAEAAYQTPLVINLTYGYTQTVSKSVEILKNPSLHPPLE